MRSSRKTYILDTSVLLADPGAFRRFGEHEVVLPVVAVTELESKRHHPELGWAARRVLRALEELRVSFGGLGEPAPVNDEGSTLRVELNHGETAALPRSLSDSTNDARILAVARNLAAEGRSVVLVTKDLPLRLRASLIGIDAEEYRNEQAVENGWTGIAELSVDPATVDLLFRDGQADVEAARGLPCHTGLVLTAARQSALGRVTADKMVRLVRPDRAMFGVSGRSAEQRIALDLLADTDLGIVSLGGSAGTGKSALALAAGLEAVLEQRTHRKLIVFRPIFAVGGQELGFVPGTETEKMRGWGLAVFDTLEAIVGSNVIDEVVDRGMLEVLPLTHIRGRSLHDTFVIVDEAQNLERMVLLTALSRMGQRTRCVLTHDVAQRDNLRVGRHDGVLSVVEMLRGHPLFAHVTLARSERSPIAALITSVLDREG
ncbi:MAG: PhoH family protein [Frankiaceae bacterium]